MWKKIYILLCVLAVPFLGEAQGHQNLQDSLVEVSGVTLTADSSFGIPNVSILIKGSDRGTISNSEGVFSIVVFKGEQLVFRAIGFKTKMVQIPFSVKGNHFGLAEKMIEDTTYLPETVVRPWPTRAEFADAFLHWKIPETAYDIARENTDVRKLRALSYYVTPDGAEGVNNTFNQQFQAAQYKGGFPPMNIFNPLAWAQFIQALKNGDFKRQQ